MQGYLQATQILLEDMPAGNYMLEVVLALPDGKNRVARSVSFRLF
jgi:hypothetical protein